MDKVVLSLTLIIVLPWLYFLQSLLPS